MKLSRPMRVFLVNFWPPFRGLGIRLLMSDDALSVTATMKLRIWNRNIVGTQFGGGLYAMIDPLFMIILMENLGPDYVVWDKAATIRFKRPGRTDVTATAHISRDEIDAIRKRANEETKVEPNFSIQIFDKHGAVIAEAEKLLFVQRRNKFERNRAEREAAAIA